MSFRSALKDNGNRLIDAKSIAYAFKEYFTSVGPMLANSIQPGNLSSISCHPLPAIVST